MATAVERAKQVTMGELNQIITVSNISRLDAFLKAHMLLVAPQVPTFFPQLPLQFPQFATQELPVRESKKA